MYFLILTLILNGAEVNSITRGSLKLKVLVPQKGLK